ncbi:MAG: hypothetical protein ACRDDE_12085 [Paraclostridium sp.]|uniref:hypothetical protein n=1 Tax=Paraclostridium sp. TaxID=2023273 RepID=UPI003EE7AFDB
MVRKILIILLNFFTSLRKKEAFDLFIIPLILTTLIYVVCNSKIAEFEKFITTFNGIVINVAAILAAFGMSSLGMLISSSSENIVDAKGRPTERKDRNNNIITYYKLQILRNFFSLFMLFGLLIYSIIFVFLLELNINLRPIFYTELFIMLISIFSQVFVVQSMYFLFVEPKINKG